MIRFMLAIFVPVIYLLGVVAVLFFMFRRADS